MSGPLAQADGPGVGTSVGLALVLFLAMATAGMSASPLGEERLFFIGRAAGHDRQVYCVRPDGGDLRALTQSARDKRRPALAAAGGTRLAYSTSRGELWLLDVQTLRETRIAAPERQDMWDQPAWSPEGQQLLAVRIDLVPQEQSDLYQLLPEPLTRPWFGMSGMEQQPAFSQDGSKVAFAYFEKRRQGIVEESLWVLDVRARQAVKVLADGSDNHHPVWLDPHELVYVSNVSGSANLWKLDVRSGVASALTTGPEIAEEPSVSPDGTRLAYMTVREGRPKLVIRELAGGAPHVLQLALEESREPVWGRWRTVK
ncbi:MAG: PD40 domain-containing protein [Candidatus Wallbacteria bacterium]|nr:PD40 domain-containing protein [Candidatus Wallbacteria bacterium]